MEVPFAKCFFMALGSISIAAEIGCPLAPVDVAMLATDDAVDETYL